MPFNQQSTNGNARNTTGKDTYLCLNTAPTGVPTLAGTISWNTTDATFDMKLSNNTTLQAGQELHFYGKASGAIGNGRLCMFNGAEGDHIKIKQIGAGDVATVQANPHYIIGIATDDIANGSYGYITWFGKVNNVYTKAVNTGDSADWVMGDVLYFSNTTGQLTNTPPNAPGIRVDVCAVIKAATGAAENGILVVRPSFGIKLMDCDDVDGIAPSITGQVLKWDNTNQYWEVDANAHNDTTSLQGGTAGQYYHLTSAQLSVITDIAAKIADGYEIMFVKL